MVFNSERFPTKIQASPTIAAEQENYGDLDMEKPRILILTTGGTIVSSGTSSMQTTGYEITDFTVEKLVASVPGIEEIAELSIKAVSNIDSSCMTSLVWLDLLEAVEEAGRSGEYDGIVVTHGTDTLEETAFFIDLVQSTDLPIVFTGAMRPATAVSADGPANLVDAVRAASSPEASGCGAFVVFNGSIISAAEAVKVHPTRVDAFAGRPNGAAGSIRADRASFNGLRRRPGELRIFSPSDLKPGCRLPRVDILYCHADDDGALVEAAAAAGAQALVLACTGNGSIHEDMEQALAASRLPIIRSSRTQNGAVVGGLRRWMDAGFIPSGSLSPQKARILAQLSIAKFGADAKKMAEVFEVFGG